MDLVKDSLIKFGYALGILLLILIAITFIYLVWNVIATVVSVLWLVIIKADWFQLFHLIWLEI